MVRVDVIFFDVDGTLVDATQAIVNAMNYVLRRLDLKERPFKKIVSYVGTGMSDLVRKSLGEKNLSLTDKALKIYEEYYAEHSDDEARLYPHVKETLEYFNGKRKVILTNRYARLADILLKKMGIRDHFEEIIGGDDERCLKPAACVLERSLPKLNINKSKAIIVGDMVMDIMMGKNSGIKTCWVTYGLGKPGDALVLKPDYVIDDIEELKNIIK